MLFVFCKTTGTLLGVLSICKHRLGDMKKAVGILILGLRVLRRILVRVIEAPSLGLQPKGPEALSREVGFQHNCILEP